MSGSDSEGTRGEDRRHLGNSQVLFGHSQGFFGHSQISHCTRARATRYYRRDMSIERKLKRTAHGRDTEANRQTGKQTDRQTDRQTGKQTNRQTDKQTNERTNE